MLTFRDLSTGLRGLDLPCSVPVLVHASLSSFGAVRGGADTLLGAILSLTGGIMMPTFTYKTMIIPEDGPADNGLVYGTGHDLNRMAVFFSDDLPADPLMGVLAETLRLHPAARRSMHPILSFAGIQVDAALDSQTLAEPLAPIAALADQEGWVVLLGVNHTVNTSFHFAERQAGRKQFVRWALTPAGVAECPGFPGCSDGFEDAAPILEEITRRVKLGDCEVRALPIQPMLETVGDLLHRDPLALLCSRDGCGRCDAVRQSLSALHSEGP